MRRPFLIRFLVRAVAAGAAVGASAADLGTGLDLVTVAAAGSN